MSLDPPAHLTPAARSARRSRSLPRIEYTPPPPETLNYLYRRVKRAARELALPQLDLQQRRLLSLRRGPKLRARLVACLQKLPRQGDLWAEAAAPVLQEILDRDGELEKLRREARALAHGAEDSLLLLSVEVGAIMERALRGAAPQPKVRATDGEAPPGTPRAPAAKRRGDRGPAWRGPLERCLEIPEAMLGIAPQRLRKVQRRLGAPVLKAAQREALRRRGPHGYESAAAALCAAADTHGVDVDHLRGLLDRQRQLRALRRAALALAEQAEGAQLLLGAYGRCIYEMLIELLEGRVQSARQPSERRRLGAEYASLLQLARTGDEKLGGADFSFPALQ